MIQITRGIYKITPTCLHGNFKAITQGQPIHNETIGCPLARHPETREAFDMVAPTKFTVGSLIHIKQACKSHGICARCRKSEHQSMNICTYDVHPRTVNAHQHPLERSFIAYATIPSKKIPPYGGSTK